MSSSLVVAVKDIFDIAGQPTTAHSKLRIDHVASVDVHAVAKLREAGAIVIGKTAMHEFATGGPSFDLPWPPTRNPWMPSHHPGGSSSGSGVAVAAGFAPVALGTDTGGSVRNPATACGVTGMKPTFGSVSRTGTFPALASSVLKGDVWKRRVGRGELHSAVALVKVLDRDAVVHLGDDDAAVLSGQGTVDDEEIAIVNAGFDHRLAGHPPEEGWRQKRGLATGATLRPP